MITKRISKSLYCGAVFGLSLASLQAIAADTPPPQQALEDSVQIGHAEIRHYGPENCGQFGGHMLGIPCTEPLVSVTYEQKSKE